MMKTLGKKDHLCIEEGIPSSNFVSVTATESKDFIPDFSHCSGISVSPIDIR